MKELNNVHDYPSKKEPAATYEALMQKLNLDNKPLGQNAREFREAVAKMQQKDPDPILAALEKKVPEENQKASEDLEKKQVQDFQKMLSALKAQQNKQPAQLKNTDVRKIELDPQNPVNQISTEPNYPKNSVELNTIKFNP
jgi:hypothetical protein